MLKFLLDEQISPKVAEAFRRRDQSVPIVSLAEWEGGSFLGASDQTVLEAATALKRVLVTCDRKTIPPLLKRLAEAGQDHGGSIFVEEKTIPSSDFGGLVQGLFELARTAARWDWKNRVSFLRR